ncbi:MAG: hexameric tyrosine-coordinated heme protein [Desulfuromonadaceae bacterium]|nr:hexameric tyrosine-coordinated heme protein [Desulfuromonadaceae bacterium]
MKENMLKMAAVVFGAFVLLFGANAFAQEGKVSTKSTAKSAENNTMNRLPDSALVLVPGGTLITATPEEGRALAMLIARHTIHNIQPDLNVLKEGRKSYAVDPNGLIAASQVVAIEFQTIAAANNYWQKKVGTTKLQTMPAHTAEPMKFSVPPSLIAEHKEILAELKHATLAGGKTGKAAKAVAAVLHPHAAKEEEYALPPLGLLQALASDKISPDMAQVLPLTDKLKHELPQMLAEHKEIVAALEQLKIAARAENKSGVEDFAHALVQHALTEEQITYPAALLVGEYVKLRLGK